MFGVKKKTKPEFNTPAIIDEIEASVYAVVKPMGFRKHGRTLHRFVSGDISQVINFQCGQAYRDETHLLYINIGIRVPECSLRSFLPEEPLKKYYHDYECTIRSRLGTVRGKRESEYDLRKFTDKIIADILFQLQTYVLPVFEILNSRDAILEKRRDFPLFDTTDAHLILIDETMIFGRRGELTKAGARFNAYYQSVLDKYRHVLEHGEKMSLRKGQRVTYHNVRTNETETITAPKNGYVTLYNANRGHLDYLDELANQLGITITAT